VHTRRRMQKHADARSTNALAGVGKQAHARRHIRATRKPTQAQAQKCARKQTPAAQAQAGARKSTQAYECAA
jgi:hypothetical protein